ncbi:hypothetical protein ACFQ60_22590 [Streptomyces zhihengii]|uniref:SPOR domain-containing protein n=1 Tax=Streptomyces zhihengii TaxID=1818004 RepID=A0ABS2UVA2_9ACTN|nr:hypothetical protein [Streptomyces zhihengii]MBM9620988.1 hypothetical protein [Streptomyces zhihengii]
MSRSGEVSWRVRFTNPDGSMDSEAGFLTAEEAREYAQEEDALSPGPADASVRWHP